MTLRKTVKKHTVALFQHNVPITAILSKARHYASSMQGNPYFPSPIPSLSQILQQADILENAYMVGLGREVGKMSIAYVERDKLGLLLKQLAIYVESIANFNSTDGESILLSSGMDIKSGYSRRDKEFTAILENRTNRVVILDCKAMKGYLYTYEMSTDLSKEENWEAIGTLRNVRFSTEALQPETLYHFRMAYMLKGKRGPWSTVLSVYVP
jgi:hypothetical protein